MKNTDLLSPVWTHLTQINAVRGEGIYLYDDANERYTDFTSGIGVTKTGHCSSLTITVKEHSPGFNIGASSPVGRSVGSIL